ncbi:MAG: hypothetical protein HC772_19475 [Leptolyngbyaceae cyanobacterium CRU_2_3]|nr:hypothetical protein [Leptolyngbyaceae cyanobacterium CRU_2_3]
MNTSQQKVQLIFGAGPLGRAIAHYLIAQGKAVRMVSRGQPVGLPRGVESVTGDATDPRFTQQVCQGAQ